MHTLLICGIFLFQSLTSWGKAMQRGSYGHRQFVSPRLPSSESAAKHIHQVVRSDIAVAHVARDNMIAFSQVMQPSPARDQIREKADRYKHPIDDVVSITQGLVDAQKNAEKAIATAQRITLYNRTVQQYTLDLVKLKTDYNLAGLAADAGSQAAEAAQAFMRPMIAEAQHAFEHERRIVDGMQTLLKERIHDRSLVFGQIEGLISKSKLGQNILEYGKIVDKYHLERRLIFISAAGAAWKAYDQSKELSMRGRLVNAAMAGGINFISSPLGLVDVGIDITAKFFGVDEKVADSISVSKWAEGTSNQFFALGRAVWHWDSRPLDELHRQNMAGENGRLYRSYAKFGEKLAQSGVVNNTMDVGINLADHAHTGISKSLAWWKAMH